MVCSVVGFVVSFVGFDVVVWAFVAGLVSPWALARSLFGAWWRGSSSVCEGRGTGVGGSEV